MRNKQKINLAYLVSHPIQYQVPLLKQLAADPNVNLVVFFRSDFSLHAYKDEGFGKTIKWDVPLLKGYQYVFLPCIRGNKKFSFFRPFNYGFKKLLKKHKIDVLWMHGYSDFFALKAIRQAKSLDIKVMVRGESTLFACDQGWLKSLFRQKMMGWLNRQVDAFLAIGAKNYEFYSHYGVPDKKIFLSPYTVDNHFFQAQAEKAGTRLSELRLELGLLSDKPIILYASKLTKRKHADDLLAGYAKLSKNSEAPNAYLVMLGDGELRGKLEQQAGQYAHWNTIKFVGFKNQSELPAYYRLADILVLPSVREPWGLVINEAMDAGCAIIASDQVGATFDLVETGVNGYRFSARDVGQLSQALSESISDNLKLEAMKQSSLDRINVWSFNETIEGIKEALRKVMT